MASPVESFPVTNSRPASRGWTIAPGVTNIGTIRMNDSAPAAAQHYYDRSTGLIVFGILTIGLGGLVALLCVFMVFGLVIQATTSHMPLSAMIPGLLMYPCLAVALVWLGIGSVMAKRWARNLLLIFSWTWLLGGIVVVAMMAVLLPMIMTHLPVPEGQQQLSTPAVYAGMAIAFVFYGFFLVVLPAIWTFFYSSRHVKGTVLWRDPNPGWTDTCPLPILGTCLWLLFSALMMAVMAFGPQGVAPFFGIFLTGLSGRTFYIGAAAAWFIAAGLMYRVDVRGWWLALAVFVFFVLSTTVTYSLRDVTDMYKLMNFPQEQIDQIQKMGVFTGHNAAWFTGACTLPFIGFLIFIKRYFR